jgi:hypothetical protein
MTNTSFVIGMLAALILPWAALFITLHLLERDRDV